MKITSELTSALSKIQRPSTKKERNIITREALFGVVLLMVFVVQETPETLYAIILPLVGPTGRR